MVSPRTSLPCLALNTQNLSPYPLQSKTPTNHSHHSSKPHDPLHHDVEAPPPQNRLHHRVRPFLHIMGSSIMIGPCRPESNLEHLLQHVPKSSCPVPPIKGKMSGLGLIVYWELQRSHAMRSTTRMGFKGNPRAAVCVLHWSPEQLTTCVEGAMAPMEIQSQRKLKRLVEEEENHLRNSHHENFYNHPENYFPNSRLKEATFPLRTYPKLSCYALKKSSM